MWLACKGFGAIFGAGSEALGGKEGRRSGSLQPIQDRGELIQKGELIQQGTHQQTHPRQRQNWSPSPASLSPAVVKAADGGSSASLTSASDESLGEASDAQQQLPATTGGCAMPQQTATFPGDLLPRSNLLLDAFDTWFLAWRS